MAIDFPNSPNVNDTYTVDDKTFIWTGDYWRVLNSPNYISTLIKDADNDTKVEVEQSADEDTVRITTGGTERYSISTDGHIIPTANETYDLGSASNRFRDLYLSGTSIDLGGVSITSDGTNLALPPISSVAGDFTVDTDTLHVDSANNRIGIGTTAPAKKLHVEGGILLDAYSVGEDEGIFFREGFATIDQPSITVWDMTNAGASPDGLSINAQDGIRFRENGGEVARFKDGLFGIGNVDPGYMLDVKSPISSGSADVALFNMSGGAVAGDASTIYLSGGNGPARSGYVQGVNVGGGNNAHALTFGTSDSSSSPVERMRIDASGNVGIGTTSPANPLHIKEDSYGLLSLDRTANANVDQQVVLAPTWNGANNTALDFNIGSTIMRLTEAGNVGIGTTSPASSAPYENYKLTLDGGGFYTYDTMSMINSYARVTADAAKPDTPGLLLNNVGANTVNWSTPGLWFTSTDSAFTTEKPKYLAGLVGRATSTYNDDNDAGMQISMYLSANNAGNGFLSTTAYGYQFGAGALHPFSDNTASLGVSARLWSVVYAASGTINTSDVRDKTDIADLDYGLDFVNSLRPVKYRYAYRDAEAEGVRTHMGFIAQEVETVLGADAPNRGLWISSGFEKTDFLDEDENPVYSDVDRQGLRYEEMIAPMVKAIQELTARIEALEAN